MESEQIKKWLKYFAWLFGGLIVLVIVALLAITQIFGDQIEKRVIAEMNEYIQTEVNIRGGVEFSVFSNFPKASIEFKDIIVMGSTRKPDDTLLIAKRVYLLANIWELISQDWNIRSVVIEEGKMHMRTFKPGVTNFQLIKPTEKTDTAATHFLLNLSAAKLKNVQYIYEYALSGVLVDLQIHDAEVAGNFTESNFYIEADAALFSNHIQIKGTDYARAKDIALEGNIRILPEKGVYSLDVPALQIQGNNFSVLGSFEVPEEKTVFDLDVQGRDLAVSNFLQLFPDTVLSYAKDYQVEGALKFGVKIKGELSKNKSPRVDISYQLDKATVHYVPLNKTVEKLMIKGSFTNGGKQRLSTSEVVVEELLAYLDGEKLQIKGSMKNLETPLYNIEANGMLSLNMLNSILTDTAAVHNLSGKLFFTDVAFKGSIEDLTMTNHERPIELKGLLSFEETRLHVGQDTFYFPQGKIEVSPWMIKMDKLQVQVPGLKAQLDGQVQYWKGYYYTLATNREAIVKPLEVDLKLKVEYLYTDLLKLPAAKSKDETNTANNNGTTARLATNVTGRIGLWCDHFRHDKLNIRELNGQVVFEPGKVVLNEFYTAMFGGNIRFTSTITRSGDWLRAETNGYINSVEISELLRELNNFGQTDLTNENLKGKLTTAFKFNADVKDGVLDYKSIYLLADITIKEGRLMNFKPLEKLSKFIRIDELRDIKFATLQNQIEVKNEVIYFPQMIIKSSAFNLAVAGTHTFANYVDYSIKLNIYDILARKFKKNARQTDEFEVLDETSFNFFITMKGPLDNPDIRYDSKMVKQQFKKQGDQMRNAIKGVYEEYNTTKEQQDWEIPEEPVYLDWEDEVP